jgi:hypothetical protein
LRTMSFLVRERPGPSPDDKAKGQDRMHGRVPSACPRGQGIGRGARWMADCRQPRPDDGGDIAVAEFRI